jgi:phosphoribosylformimino-5-aminoimidazole carboxamide ribotide isomerase
VILYPAIDLKDGACVRLVQGEMASATRFNDDPAAQARAFAAAGAEWLHVVDLDGAFGGRSVNGRAVEAILGAVSIPCQLGGGIRDRAAIEFWLARGVARVILGTAAFGPLPLAAFVEALDGRLAVSVDVADGTVRTAGWLESGRATTAEALERCTSAGVTHVVCTAIDRDGTAAGPDLELLRAVRGLFAGTVFAAGGIRDTADVEAVRATGVDGVVVGRAHLEGTLAL